MNLLHDARSARHVETATAIALGFLFAALPTIAARANGIDTVMAYAGTWQSHIVHYKTAYSKARIEDTHLRNDCWRSAGYFACNQFVNGPSKALVVFTYDATRKMYHTYAVPVDGTPASSGTLFISGDTWTFPWTDHDKGKTVYGRVINIFHGPDTIEFRQEFSYDQAHWTVAARGSEHRVSH